MQHNLETFVALESQVWAALVNGDQAADLGLLSDGFLGVYTTGFADRHEHAGQLAGGPTVARYEIENPRLHSVSAEAVLFSYLATFTRTAAGAEPEQMYISSLWEQFDGSWLNTFSQDTPAG